mmetsp:Transcript_27859/g.39871  ORF Transcript_27859/g.39871 Transcript_27859/m.39871 type:complete len:134 (+) Transcript_27859:86-487(+)|eukprot:CAMPEP_0201686396 /NCGR_PEP_ID=MMETSP0578-20130828/859_1 /ASSEMBLY_ACC=CAM_ASM_000663 /TAXON_ID=267565 /ORGANISM="Skeletonema grethea, Strain CCMP 1804" /LENGTH=133 /DNA_ID=CAMNT_0048170449 /DNA_START=86 /DNA_END=487 /DNA_ORIENTATION=+
MGGIASKAKAFDADLHQREEHALGPPSKTMDASEYAQELVYLVSRTVETHLNLLPVPGKRRTLEAKQMIIRVLKNRGEGENDGKMYYIKCKTDVAEWPWIFVKLYEPPLVTGVARVEFRAMKKMKEEYKLVTF